jgi:hypothetical protein
MPVDSSMLTIVTVVQQFMVKFIGAMSWEENTGDYKNCLKFHEAKWPLDFIGGSY